MSEVIATEAGHWYLKDGSPFYTKIGKNGKERPVTLRDARPVQAVPSVSAIMKEGASPGLVNYFKNQVALAAAHTPRDPEEGVQAYMDRILAISRVHSETARDAGTAIHGQIERALSDTVWIPSVEASAAIKTLGEWCGLSGLRSEKSFAHALGYGGKVDVHKDGFVADFKTKEFAELDLPKTWDNHSMQLAAYKEGLGIDTTSRCAIIYVSTLVPGLTHLVEIDEDEIERGWNMFQYLLHYWQEKNRYWPTKIIHEEELI